MNTEIYQAMITLIKTGGPLALWGVGIWLAFTVLKLAILCLTIYLVVYSVEKTVITVHQQRLNYRQARISLLSTEITKEIMDCLTSFQKEISSLLKDLELQFQVAKKD